MILFLSRAKYKRMEPKDGKKEEGRMEGRMASGKWEGWDVGRGGLATSFHFFDLAAALAALAASALAASAAATSALEGVGGRECL